MSFSSEVTDEALMSSLNSLLIGSITIKGTRGILPCSTTE
jgi:hypothetical protein